MKKHLPNSLRALFLSLAVLLSLPVLAVEVEIDGINYELEAEIKEATIIWMSYYSSEVVIPESVEHEGTTYSVTSIGERAFQYCSALTSVTIPNSVTSIGEDAFEYCSRLTSVHISDIAAWCNIEFYNYDSNPLYYAHHLYLNGEEVKDLVIPNSVTSIGYATFLGCSSLTSVTIPNSVTSIGHSAFCRCYGLTSVTIPNSVTSIGDYAFEDCSGLTSVSIPNSVTSIGNYAFEDCSGLTSVHISDIAAWCNIDFKRYDSNPLYYAHHLYLNGEEVKDLVIPNSVKSIGRWAFCRCPGLTSVTIPNSVTSIGYSAFSGCSGLTSVTIPNSVTSIGGSAFDGCHFVTENFVNNSSLSAEENIYWGATLHGYETEDGLLIDNTNVAFCRKSANIVTIPNSVTSIGESAFSGCSSLTSVTIPNSVTSIGKYAFSGCSGLTSVTIPNSVTSIGEEAFYWCSGLTSVTIPNSVTSIGDRAFQYCDGLTSVTIGNGVTSIGDYAFDGCKLQTIVCKAVKPASDFDIDSENMEKHTQLYVPEGAYWDYAFSGWGKFIRIKEMAMDTENLDSRKVYMIADATGRNYTVYDGAKGTLVNIAYTHALDEENEGSCWTVLKEGDASYLYNIGAKKYGAIAENGSIALSDSPVELDITNTENGLSINGKSCMFVLNNNISFDATGITETEKENIKSENSAVYDLSGRRVQKAQKGIYIQNGKVMVK